MVGTTTMIRVSFSTSTRNMSDFGKPSRQSGLKESQGLFNNRRLYAKGLLFFLYTIKAPTVNTALR